MSTYSLISYFFLGIAAIAGITVLVLAWLNGRNNKKEEANTEVTKE